MTIKWSITGDDGKVVKVLAPIRETYVRVGKRDVLREGRDAKKQREGLNMLMHHVGARK